MIICVHQLVIEVVFDTLVSITIKSMSSESVQSVLERDTESGTRNRRPIFLGGWLSGVINSVVDNRSAGSDDFDVQLLSVVLVKVSL